MSIKLAYFILATLILLLIQPATSFTVGYEGKGLVASVSPGEEFTQTIYVTLDEGETASDILLEVLGYGYSESGDIAAIEPEEDTNPYSARTFFSPTSASFTIKQGETAKTDFTVTIPSDFSSGGRYAIFRITKLPAGAGKVSIASALQKQVIYTIDRGKQVHTGAIRDLHAGEAVADRPIDFFTTVENTGNHHYRLTNEVEVKGPGGEILATLTKNTQILIPGASFVIKTTYSPEQALARGTYTVYSRVSLEDGTLIDEETSTFEITGSYIPPLQAAEATISPSGGGSLRTGDGRVTVDVPAGAVSSSVVLKLGVVLKGNAPQAPSGAKVASTAFRLEGIAGMLAKDATITVQYIQPDLDAAGGDASKLALARWNEAENKWVFYRTSVNANARTLTATTNQLSTWAVMVVDDASLFSSSAKAEAETPLPLWVPVLAAGLLFVLVGRRKIHK